MSEGTFYYDYPDIEFLLYEHLHVEEIFKNPAHQSFSKEDADIIIQEAFRFAKEQIFPTNAQADQESCQFKDGKVTIPQSLVELYPRYIEAGWLGLSAPEEFGGAHVPYSVGVAVTEAMLSANLAFSTYPGLTGGVAHLLEAFGDPWMKEIVIPGLYEGRYLGTMCITEPQAGSAVGDARTIAKKKGDRYLISGNKIFITAGDHVIGENIIHLVLARTPEAPAGIKGLSLFLVPKYRLNKDGSKGEFNDVHCSGIEEKLGIHGSVTTVLNFGDNDKCEGLLFGKEGDGIKIMFHMMNEARLGTGLQGLSGAALAYQTALHYAHERIQGTEIQNFRDVNAPRVPIIKHPDVKRMVFDMKAKVEGMRALIYFIGYCADQVYTHPEKEVRKKHIGLLEFMTPICKAFCSDIGFDVTVTAMQVMAGAGYVCDGGVEQLLRDVKIASIYEGANGIQALDLVGRKLAYNNGEYFLNIMECMGDVVKAYADHPLLSDLAKRFDEEISQIRAVTGQIAAAGLANNYEYPALVATNFLQAMGNLIVAWKFLEQAAVAHDKLSAMLIEREITTTEAKTALIAESDKAAFYDAKIHTVKFFYKNVLSQNKALVDAMTNNYTDFLNARLI